MLTLSAEQFHSLAAVPQLEFERRMLAHAQAFSPVLCGVLGPDQTWAAVHGAVHRARSHGFTLTGPIRLFVELCFLRGSLWDRDPQYHRAQAALETDEPEMQCAQALRAEYADYQHKVCGDDNGHVLAALQALRALASQPLPPSLQKTGPDLAPALQAQLADIFPRKADYIGQDGLARLVQGGLRVAGQAAWVSPRHQVLVVALMFAFGAGCFMDPLYPWILRTVQAERTVDPKARAERLERKALTWLDHVLARARESRT
jgi:hypothetical protein